MVSRNETGFTYFGNEMLTASGATLTYDKNGNQTTSRKDASTSMTLEYNWDNKLRSAAIGSDEISLKYDPAGNRIRKDSSTAGDRKYIVDIAGDLPVILLEIDPANMSVKKGYIYANSQILAQYSGADKHYYLHDRLGSIRELINQNGVIVAMYTYSPFGETVEETIDQQLSTNNYFKFTGQYLDSETGQYYLRARQYSPYLSRFTGRDPVMCKFEEPMTLHKYLYCQNDPINRWDPMGLIYLPDGPTDYNETKTQGIINHFDNYVFNSMWSPIVRAITGLGPFGEFDYGNLGAGSTFKLVDDKYVMEGRDFGNYLAGRMYRLGCWIGESCSRIAGHMFQEGWQLDSAQSQYWIARGALDANLEMQESAYVKDDLILTTILEMDEGRLRAYAEWAEKDWKK